MFFLNNQNSVNKEIIYDKTKKVMLFTNARNEKNIKEWATHHLLVGFDMIVIFDHKSIIPLQYVFRNFDKRVKIIPCNLDNPVKITLMNKAIYIAKLFKVDWFIYLDADEFLILNNYEGVKKMLNNFPYAHSLSVNWLLFGTNNFIKDPPGLLLENYTKSTEKLDKHVKTFVRPKEIKNVVNPHYYNMKKERKMYNIDKRRMNPSIGFAFHENIISYKNVDAYIAHYVHQSEQTYIRRKILLPQDDTGTMRSKDPNIHNYYNDVDNDMPKKKYTHNIKKFMEQYNKHKK